MQSRVILLSLLVFVTGCASYEYDLLQPPRLARHIGPEPVVLAMNPLQYTLQSDENHLIMLIRNPTTQPVFLIGDRSVVVDPAGQSHPVLSRTIAPMTYIKLILPPLPLRVYDAGAAALDPGPAYIEQHHGGVVMYRDFYYDEPRYQTVYDPGDPTFFRWDGETNVRITLTFQSAPAAAEFQDSFLFHRRKAD